MTRAAPLNRTNGSYWLAVAAFVIWYVIVAALGRNLIGPIVFSLQVIVVFLFGYAMLSFWRPGLGALTAILATILGLQVITTIYALVRLAGFTHLHLIVLVAGAAYGAYRLIASRERPSALREAADKDYEACALAVGAVVMLAVGVVFFRSGRLDADGLVFFGPMSRDPIFHLALLRRLEYVVPPDNFVAAGFYAPAYHFFCDLSQIMLWQWPWQPNSLFDTYFRLYPAPLYFAIGFLAFWVPARFFESTRAGVIGAAMIMFGADLSWLPGLLQTVKALPHLTVVQHRLFDPWIAEWDAFGELYPLVHRPAHYYGLLMFLAGLAFVARQEMRPIRMWALAGVIWGMMAGFNYTFAATLGISIAIAAVVVLSLGERDGAKRLAVSALCLAAASIPANVFVLILGGALNSQAGSALRLAPAALAVTKFGSLFARIHSGAAVLLLSFAALVILSYGLQLFGLKEMVMKCRDWRRPTALIATVLAAAFAVSFLAGMLLISSNIGEVSNNIIFLQPTGWILGLFAAGALARWAKPSPLGWRVGILAFLLLFAPIQGLIAFNFGYKVVIGRDLLQALRRVEEASNKSDVIAFEPASLPSRSILGTAPTANNFYFTALTGLRGYLSTPGYTRDSAGPDGAEIYRTRSARIERLAAGQPSAGDIDELRKDGVRWVFLPAQSHAILSEDYKLWATADGFAILRLGSDRKTAK